MPRKQTLKGAGLTDLINNAREYLRELSSDIPTKLNNISSQTLKQYGNNAIQNITIMRSPLKSHWINSLNALSMGKFEELKQAYGFDKLYHLSLIVQAGETIIIEKNEVIKIAPFDQNNISNQADFLNVPLMGKSITLNEMINNTKAFMGIIF